MITFPVEDTFPLSDGNFHNKKSIISEHYGFTDALTDDDVCLFCDKKLKDEKYKEEMGVACHDCFTSTLHHVDYVDKPLPRSIRPHDAAHVAFENFLNNEENNEPSTR